jgi:predicted MFS family arabinose efflux permease
VAAQSTRRFDLIGAGSFMAGLICLLLGMNQGSAWGWASPPVAAALVAAVVLLGCFIAVELRSSSPMLDLRLFRIRRFTASVVSAVFNYICVYTLLFLLPFYLITGRGLNTAQAGLVLTAQPLVMAIMAPLSGALSDRIGTRLPSTLGMAILGVGLFLLSRIGAQSSLLHVAGGLAVCGFGTGIFISPNNSALMGAAPRDQQGVAGAVLATARNVGMVLGVGIAGAVFTTILGGAQADAASSSLFSAIQVSMLVASGAAAIGTVVAALRGT